MVAREVRLDGSIKMWEEYFVVAEARQKERTTSWEYKLTFSKDNKVYKDDKGCEWFPENTPTLEKCLTSENRGGEEKGVSSPS